MAILFGMGGNKPILQNLRDDLSDFFRNLPIEGPLLI